MALSLTQVTANNVSGTYTPNITLAGHFVLTLSGPTEIQAPTGLVLTPQLIVISCLLPENTGLDAPILTWSDDWQPWLGQFSAYGGPPWGLINTRGRVYTCLVGTGLSRILSFAYWNPG